MKKCYPFPVVGKNPKFLKCVYLKWIWIPKTNEPLPAQPWNHVIAVHQLPCFCVSRCHQWLSFTSWVLSNLSLANSNLGEQIKWQSSLRAKQMQGFSKNGINCQCQLTEAKSERSSRRNGKQSWKTDINTMSERKGKLIKGIWLGHTKQS